MEFYCEELLPYLEELIKKEYKKNIFLRKLNAKKIKWLEKLFYECILDLEKIAEKEL